MRPSQETVVRQAQLATVRTFDDFLHVFDFFGPENYVAINFLKEFHRHAGDFYQSCSRLVHEQALQQRAWKAVIANLEQIGR